MNKLCNDIKNVQCWDEIFVEPAPRTNFVTGFRINITKRSEEEIAEAEKMLQNEGIVFEDRKATSFSPTVQPGDRTLRVIHQNSVLTLRRMWGEELKKARSSQMLKKER